MIDRLPYPDGVWAVDAEFRQDDGYPIPQEVHCVVAKDCMSGTAYRLWTDDLQHLDAPPFPIGSKALILAYSAPAELQTFQALGWPLPINLMDVMQEFLLVANKPTIPGQPPVGRKLNG